MSNDYISRFILNIFQSLSDQDSSMIENLYDSNCNFHFHFSKGFSISSPKEIIKFLKEYKKMNFYPVNFEIQQIMAPDGQWFQIVVFGTFEQQGEGSEDPIMASFHSSIHCFYYNEKLFVAYQTISIF